MPVRLEVRDLAWGPSPERLIVEIAGFAVEPGEILAIVGPNGAGKSTLLRCLYRHHRPVRGAVLVDGQDLWRMGARAAATRVAAVLQEVPPDFPFTVREVVGMGRTPHRQGFVGWGAEDGAIVSAMLRRFELDGFADRSFQSLSGGEKQRVLLARALAQQPGLIVLDEPTNHLDIRHQLEILDILRGLDMTIVTTLHDLNLAAAVADRVMVLSNGRCVGIGPPDEVMTPEMISRAFGVGADIDRHPRTGALRFSFHLPQDGTS